MKCDIIMLTNISLICYINVGDFNYEENYYNYINCNCLYEY